MITICIIAGSILGFFFAIAFNQVLQLVESAKKVNYYLSFITDNVGWYRPIESYFSGLDFIPYNLHKVNVRDNFSYRLYFSKTTAHFSFFMYGQVYKEYSVEKRYWKLFLWLTKIVKI